MSQRKRFYNFKTEEKIMKCCNITHDADAIFCKLCGFKIKTPVLTIKEMQKMSGFSSTIIRTACKTGQLKAWQRKRGGTYYVEQRDFES